MYVMPLTAARVAAVAASLSLLSSSADPQSKSSTERVVLESSGWQLMGDWVMPSVGGSIPAALLLHRAAGSRGEYAAMPEALALCGIASLSLDLRGHGDSVNLGKFEPPYAEHRGVIESTHEDVRVALQWIAARAGIDEDRIAAVGASYSGEAIGEALRESGESVATVVMLPPGSFSSESIALVDGLDQRLGSELESKQTCGTASP